MKVAAVIVWAAMTAVPYTYYTKPDKDQVCVRVQWVERESDAAPLCGGSGQGCFNGDRIVSPIPRSFNDERRLLILGHEFLHALGAHHD